VKEPTDRRQFFTRLVRGGAHAVQEAASALSVAEASPPRELPPAAVLVQPPAVAHTASVGELLTLADEEEGLRRRHGELLDLARPSVRITAAGEGDPVGAQLGGAAEPDGSQRTWRPLAQIQLADPALSALRLPSTGRLTVLMKTVREIALREPQCTEARVMLEPDTPGEPSSEGRDGPDGAPAGFARRL
jgi:hypothetical protein